MANILKSGSWVRIAQKDGSIDIGCVDSTPMKNGEGKTAYGVTNLAGKRNIIVKDQEIEHLKRSLSEVNQENEKLKEQITIGVSKKKIGALNNGLKKSMVEVFKFMSIRSSDLTKYICRI